jgi:uncharacterized cupin superfamily protein
MSIDPKALVVRSAETKSLEQTFSHPWNPQSSITGVQLGRRVGLRRTGVNFARVPPGKESFVYHSHEREEEWIYILAGRAIVEIADEEFEVGPGDFIGFPTPSVAHHLRNPFEEEVVYLMGGENVDVEVADFPRLGKRMIRRDTAIVIYDVADSKPFGPLGQE